MIVFQVVFCVLGMVGLVTSFNWADRRIAAAVISHRAAVLARQDAVREEIIRREITVLQDAQIAAFYRRHSGGI